MDNNIKLLRKESYARFVEKLAAARQVYAPVRRGGKALFSRIGSAGEIAEDLLLTDLSPKSFVFPRIEKLFGYSRDKTEVAIKDIDLDAIPERVILGARPCDAMGLEALAAIFGWEPADPIFTRRRERTTIVAYSCAQADADCFCTSVGGAPDGTKGVDMMLTKTSTGDYVVETITPKGQALAGLTADLLEDTDASGFTRMVAEVPVRFSVEGIGEKMSAAFDTEAFDQFAVRCLGCGACAYVCPTCACFDIQDEARGGKGIRTRSWDSCGGKLFTLHASGHNPRQTQGARWRQRLMHKFSYMPERLDVVGCVGCGRCSRRCPVDMNIAENMESISKGMF